MSSTASTNPPCQPRYCLQHLRPLVRGLELELGLGRGRGWGRLLGRGLVRVRAWAQTLELEPTLALVLVSPLTRARASALAQRRWPARLVHRHPRYPLVPCLQLVRRSSLPYWPRQPRRRALGAVRSLRPRL